jgi:hypothetical protein
LQGLHETQLHHTHYVDKEIVRQTLPAVESKITDIHSVTGHQRLVQATEHRASELTSSVAVFIATAVQIQGLPMMLCTD